MTAPSPAALATLGLTPEAFQALAPAAQQAIARAATRVKAPKAPVEAKPWETPDGKTITLAKINAHVDGKARSVTLGPGKLFTVLAAVDAAGGDTAGLREQILAAGIGDAPEEN